ncbi:hypothetical protein CLV78_104273 [Aliiruegeria haliotis]|uniref:Nuclease-like protein n=1 Tax=Aliiruegeria haliotis TaxID=1280846 RepID=A0A2T0RRK2_9RHOB|nr:hypothetical protein [Aliiruegeria haliotis]PRY23781.1 hypothetical protein CLV78_104273 [Aliiruegeria haliotis]
MLVTLATGFALLLTAVQGEVYVARADTLVISGTAVRLRGIVLPDQSRDEEEAARQVVQAIVKGHFVSCRLNGERDGHMMLGKCLADGEDIADMLVSQGVALECSGRSDRQDPAPDPDGPRDDPAPDTTC